MGEKKKKKTASSPLPRKIHMGTGEWSYQIGKTGVNIRTPDLTKTQFIPFTKMFGMTPAEVEAAHDNHSLNVKPNDVRDYIAEHLEQTV
jgi:hypothetical protein